MPRPTADVEFIDLLLRVAHMAADRWRNLLTGLGTIFVGIALGLSCLIPGLNGNGGDGFDSGDCD